MKFSPALFCMASALAASAHAGSVSTATAGASLRITGDGYTETVSFNQFLRIDPSTGAVVFDLSAADAIGDDNWSRVDNTAGLSYRNADTGRDVTPTSLLRWHTWETVNSSLPFEQGTNPWRTSIDVVVGGNVDPFMAYAYAVRNNTAGTLNYTYIQGESLVPPVAGPYDVYADIAGSLTNTAVTPSATVAPITSHIQNVWLGNAGVATVNAGVGVGSTFTHTGSAATAPGNPATQAYATDFATVASGGGYDYWEFRVSFSLTGRDAAAFTGFAEITPVPEPETYALFALGLVVVAGHIRGRSRR